MSAALSYMLVMIFDIGGAMFGLGNLAGILQEGVVPGATWAFVAAGVGSLVSAYMGSTPMIIAAEGAVGIKEGGRTGLTAITTACCFLIALFFAPLLQVTCPLHRQARSPLEHHPINNLSHALYICFCYLNATSCDIGLFGQKTLNIFY
jgi:xanthine/uracil/vitamin C permease (AzgA family)